jgi:hypothetical protein
MARFKLIPPVSRPFRTTGLLATVFILTISLQGCGTSAAAGQLHLMPMEGLPEVIQQAPSAVRQAYQFAAANPEVLRALPCYCGCGNVGHTSNLDCYLGDIDESGTITFDNHALGCTLCVDITQDAMRLLREGRELPAIREYVDARYARFGPSNMP